MEEGEISDSNVSQASGVSKIARQVGKTSIGYGSGYGHWSGQ